MKRFEAHSGFAEIVRTARMLQKTMAGVEKGKRNRPIDPPAGIPSLFRRLFAPGRHWKLLILWASAARRFILNTINELPTGLALSCIWPIDPLYEPYEKSCGMYPEVVKTLICCTIMARIRYSPDRFISAADGILSFDRQEDDAGCPRRYSSVWRQSALRFLLSKIAVK